MTPRESTPTACFDYGSILIKSNCSGATTAQDGGFRGLAKAKRSSEIGLVQKGLAFSLPSCRLCLTTAAQHDPGLVF